jgi:hypothetical protein
MQKRLNLEKKIPDSAVNNNASFSDCLGFILVTACRLYLPKLSWSSSIARGKFWNNILRSARPRHSSGDQSPAFHRDDPGSIPGQVMWDLWWTKWHWGMFLSSASVFLAISRSTSFSIIIILDWYNRALNGRRTKWTQSHLNHKKLKKNN